MKVKYSGKQATKYAQIADELYSWKFLEKPAIERHLKPLLKSNTKVLDAGCGMGRTIELILDLGVKEKNLIGSDISSDMLKVARKLFPNIKFLRANLPDLKLRNDSLDVVVSNMTLHYLNQKDFKKTIKNISKWLVKEGWLFFIVVHPLRFSSNYSDYNKKKVKVEKTPWGTEIEYYPKKISEYINEVINSGFELTCVEEPTPAGSQAKKNVEDFIKYSSIPTRLLVKARKTAEAFTNPILASG
jgi:ubiquinone/menaquinone biosynthesis C-methylase UbiE